VEIVKIKFFIVIYFKLNRYPNKLDATFFTLICSVAAGFKRGRYAYDLIITSIVFIEEYIVTIKNK